MSLRTNKHLPARLAAAGQIAKTIAAWVSARLWLTLPLLALPALWTFFASGLPASADGMLHLMRLVLLDRHVQQGVFFPRWVPQLFLGYGCPVFNFYAPSTYYLAEALHLLGLGYEQSLMAALGLLVLASGVVMFLLTRKVFGPQQR